MSWQRDPLYELRHAIVGVVLAVLVSMFVAAFAGRVLGDLIGDSYETRLTVYLVLLVYVLVGAGVLVARVARYETKALTARRVALWVLALWAWPALFAVSIGRGPGDSSKKESAAKDA